MANNKSLVVTDLDFFSIKNNLKNFLRSQEKYTDYDFEGSGLSVLLDVLAYNTYYQGVFLSIDANESFRDTAQIRNNILSLAKDICYVPASPQGAISLVTITATPTQSEDSSPTQLTLDKYTRVLGQDKDGVNYPFVTIYSNTAPKVDGAFTFSNVTIKQGEVITRQFAVEANNTTRRFQIPSPSVDTTTIVVTVQTSSSNSSTEVYTLADDLTEVTANSRVYWIEEDNDLYYTVYFGDDVLGKKPADGNIVIVTYLDTVGSLSNSISRFSFVEPIGGVYRNNVSVRTISGSYGGVDKEDISKIRFRAPYFYTAQNRAVTVPDYESLVIKDYNNIDSVSVWGGEDNDPPVYGKVYLSLKTKNYYALSNLEKERIKRTLITNRNVLTVIPEIVDPDYIFLLVSGKVYYNPSLTSLTAEEIGSLVRTAIVQYNNDELNAFSSVFRKSKLQQYIEECEPSITGSDITIYLQSRVQITLNQALNYQIDFNIPLRKGDYVEKLSTYPQLTVLDSNRQFRNVFFEEVPSSFTGIDSINMVNAGMNYSTTPTVTITGDGTGASAVASLAGDRVQSITILSKGVNYTKATVTITGDGSEASAEAVLEARHGVLRSFYYKDNGEKVVVNDQAGTIDYDTGRIILTRLLPYAILPTEFYNDDIVTVNVVPEEDVIFPTRNSIIALDQNNYQSIQIQMVNET